MLARRVLIVCVRVDHREHHNRDNEDGQDGDPDPFRRGLVRGFVILQAIGYGGVLGWGVSVFTHDEGFLYITKARSELPGAWVVADRHTSPLMTHVDRGGAYRSWGTKWTILPLRPQAPYGVARSIMLEGSSASFGKKWGQGNSFPATKPRIMNTRMKMSSLKPTGGALMACALLGFMACDRGPSPEEQALLSRSQQLELELASRDSLIADMTRSFSDIENNLAMMDDREKLLQASSTDELSMDQRQRIARDVQLMNSLMKESRDRIAELTKRLDKSKIESSGLRKKLKDLDMQLAARDSAMTGMKDELLARDFKIEQVNQQLSAIELEIARREATIEQLGDQMNTAYYAVGSEKELEASGVITRSGGVLGLGRTAALNEAATADRFRVLDTRDTKRIPLAGEKLELVTEHPAGSYEVVEENEKLAYLEIKDPEAFWRLSRYMVAEVK